MRSRHHHLKHNALALAAAAALGPLAVLPASAATCTWSTTAGNWAALANWLACVTGGGNPTGTPGAADAANIGATGVVTINTGQSIGTLNNAGQINIDAFGLNLAGGGSTVNSGILNVGGASTANLGISAAHNLNNTGGVINVATGSVVNQFGSTITGGTINTTGTGALTVFSSSANFLSGVTLNGRMDMASNAASRQRITSGLTLGSSAIVDLNNNGILSFEGTSTLGGSGSIVLGTTAGNRIDLDGTGTTTFASGVTVRGHTGVIGQQLNIGGTQVLQNNGTIQADVAGGTITITDSNVINSGTLAALNGGTLVLSSNVSGAGGQIVAGAGSTVRQNGVTLSGAINTSGSGLFTASSSSANFLSGVTLNGSLDMASIAASRERVTAGGLVLNGTININQNGILGFENNGGLSGNGTIVLGATGAGNRIDFEGTGTTTFAASTLVRGENGVIGQQLNIGGTQVLQNNGTIQADVSGGTITITESNVINSGTLAALNGGRLVLNSNVTGTATGQILSGAGSTVLQSGVTLSGAINTSGGGLFTAISSSANFLDGVTLNGNLDMASVAASRERVTAGGLVLNGTINIDNNGILGFEGNGGLSGSGTVVLGATGPGNRIDFEGTGTTTFAAGTLVRGQNGVIGQQLNIGGTQVLQNNGTIQADVSGGTITITESNVINSGTLAALNGGTLVLNSNVTGTATGQILSGAGSTVQQNGVTLEGIINTTGGGLFSVVSSSANRLTGVTFNGTMDMASIGASRQRVSAGGMELNGTITIDNNGILGFENNGTFSGGANIVFGTSGAGNRIDLDGTGTTTFASGVTVRGHSGTIGQQLNIGGTQTLINNGLISADTSGGTISITESNVNNNNRIEARNTGTLVLSSDVTNGASGVILADNGVVRQSGVRITGGTIASANGGSLRVVSSSANYLDNVTVTGVVDMATLGGSRQRVNNGLTLSGGTINIDNSGILGIEGTSTIGGTGSIVLGSAGAGNRIDLEGTGVTTIGSSVTVRGHSGTIGQQLNIGGTQTLVNNGTVNADVSGGTITFADSALVNNGLVRAQAGTVNIGVPLSGTGVLQVDATGVMNLANGAKSQGQLVMGATGAALNLGSGNLTISSDYTNAGAGSGNSFNRRAGVTGTGQIVAAADAAQRITGAAVTNGATTNATLTIGSVRVGANTFNYEVGNSGTTGPTLRGAVQTSVNGGNITDARLSGGGVTAGLYNAGAPGGSSGPQSVVFTASSAGLLAPLTGQALNLRSNFENIADQKLNIVLAGGAAAYNAAVGSATPTPVTLANQRVGGTLTQTLTVSNTAAAGAFSEDLRASFGAITGPASNNGGSIAALVAGGSDGSAMRVGVLTGVAGAMTGSVTLNYQTTGTVAGVSNGLGMAAIPDQVINVSGNVYQLASGALQTAPMNFGTIQVGQVRTQDLVVRNTAAGAAGFVEDLHAAFGASGNSQITGAGTLAGILAGTDSTAANGLMRVTVNASTVGALNSSIAVNYTSAGAVAGVSNGLGTLAVGSQDYGVSGIIEAVGTVISQANPLVNTPTINLGAVRVGAAAPTGTVSVTNVASGGLQAALNASIAPTSGPITAAGSFSLLDPGATNASSLLVGLNTGTAGNFTGAGAGKATISFVSDASNVGGCAPSCTLDLAPQVVNVEGKVYTQAVGSLVTGAVNFGVVRVGDTVAARDITINNTAAVSALNDTLRGDLGGVGGPFGHAGSVASIAAGGSGSLSVGLNTSSAGIFSQTGTMGFTSQNADMADVSAGADASVSVFAQVNNLANGDFDLLSGMGTLTQSGTEYVLDLGNLVLGSSVSSVLQMDNDVSGPADELSGLFDLSSADDFGYGGWNPLSLLAAGDAGGAMSLNWLAGALGSYADTIVFNGRGTNASDSTGLAQSRRLTIRATVIGGGGGTVPVPGTLSLLLAAAAAAGLSRRAIRKVAP